EHDLAVGAVGDALGVDVEGLDGERAVGVSGSGGEVDVSGHPPIVSGRGAGPGACGPVDQVQAARYSCQCGSPPARPPRVSFTKAISLSYSSGVKPPRIFWKRQYSR